MTVEAKGLQPLGTMAEEYENVKMLLRKIVWNFHRKYKGDYEELLSEAYEHFVDVYHSYDSTRVGKNGKSAKFSSWVCFKVNMLLLETKRSQAKFHSRYTHEQITHKTSARVKEPFSLHRLLSEVSPDAAKIIRVALLDRPRKRDEKKRRCVLEFFRELGWAAARIVESVREIREALLS